MRRRRANPRRDLFERGPGFGVPIATSASDGIASDGRRTVGCSLLLSLGIRPPGLRPAPAVQRVREMGIEVEVFESALRTQREVPVPVAGLRRVICGQNLVVTVVDRGVTEHGRLDGNQALCESVFYPILFEPD